MDKKKLDNVIIEDAQIRFRNFSGKGDKFNPEGKRNFCVLLDEPLANALKSDGWNIKYLRPRDEGDKPQPYMQVNVNFDGYQPPKIYLITGKGKTLLDKDTVSTLDWAEIEKVDIIINPYVWDTGDKQGVKGYVKTMYVMIAEDELDRKYAAYEDSDYISSGPEELPFD